MHRYSLSLVCVLCLFLCGTACLPAKKQPAQGQDTPSIASLLILPVDPVVSVKTDINAEKLNELRQGAVIMDELLNAYLTNLALPNLAFLEEQQFEGYIGARTGTRLALGVTIAKEMAKDAVLSLRLSRFSERRGAKYSADSPASLAFEYKLIDTHSGAVLCGGTFDESQEALFDNLFSFSGKKSFRWLPIREFAADALQEKLDGCAVLQASRPR